MENLTRWSSSFNMLLSFHNAYLKDVFNGKNKCPVTLEVIDKYIQILLPAHMFNLRMQKDEAIIGEVVPFIMAMIDTWKRMDVSNEYKVLCQHLVSAFEFKFDYELNSPVYHVASYLNTGRLETWINRPDCRPICDSAYANIQSVRDAFKQNKEALIEASDGHILLPENHSGNEEEEDEFSEFMASNTFNQVSSSEVCDRSGILYLKAYFLTYFLSELCIFKSYWMRKSCF